MSAVLVTNSDKFEVEMCLTLTFRKINRSYINITIKIQRATLFVVKAMFFQYFISCEIITYDLFNVIDSNL